MFPFGERRMFYRIYRVDKEGHIRSPPQQIERDDDAAAIEHAKTLLDGRDLEVWEGPRRVIILRHTIHPYLEGGAFDPETIETMAKALSEACKVLRVMDKEDAAVRILALRIIDQARDGIRDAELLKFGALRGFRN
jgi:hypothetical protein